MKRLARVKRDRRLHLKVVSDRIQKDGRNGALSATDGMGSFVPRFREERRVWQ
jgi:hypothetical protein